MINIDKDIKGWHHVTDLEELEDGKLYFVETELFAAFMMLLKHEDYPDIPFPYEIYHFCGGIDTAAFHYRLDPEKEYFSIYAPDQYI